MIFSLLLYAIVSAGLLWLGWFFLKTVVIFSINVLPIFLVIIAALLVIAAIIL